VSAPARLYQQIEEQIARCAGSALRITSTRRLASLVLGVVASEQCGLRRAAGELGAMGLRPAQDASTARRLRRTLADARLDDGAGYGTALHAVVDWVPDEPVVLALDESTTPGGLRVLRLSLTYRGGCVPLAWQVWDSQTKLPRGGYWRHIDAVLDQAAAVLPPGLRVVVVADRAYDGPAVIDRLAARGWAWIIRVKARSKLVWRHPDGHEQPLREVVGTALVQPGTALQETGETFKKARWRAVHLVGAWGVGYAEPLVVLTNLAPDETLLARYGRRFWIEAAFRHDKGKGWQWEQSQVRDPAHQWRLLLALAWASLLVLSLGAAQAAQAVAAFQARTGPLPTSTHPRDSLFHVGLGRIRARLYGTVRGSLPWRLPHLTAPSWCAEWRALHQPHPLSQSVRP
jgi:hypothetical protein